MFFLSLFLSIYVSTSLCIYLSVSVNFNQFLRYVLFFLTHFVKPTPHLHRFFPHQNHWQFPSIFPRSCPLLLTIQLHSIYLNFFFNHTIFSSLANSSKQIMFDTNEKVCTQNSSKSWLQKPCKLSNISQAHWEKWCDIIWKLLNDFTLKKCCHIIWWPLDDFMLKKMVRYHLVVARQSHIQKIV